MSYKIASPDQYLAITGMGVKGIKICKSAWVMPFQKCMRFSVQPHDYAMDLTAMTKEKLQFRLPVAFTVGPRVPERVQNKANGSLASAPGVENTDDTAEGLVDPNDALYKYVQLLAENDSHHNDMSHLSSMLKSIIEGEVRVLVSSMTIEEIFTEREEFKRRIFKNIQSDLNQFGLKIYNSNIKELKDAPNSTYFESLSRKAHEGATNQARIDVASAQLLGNVGEAKRKGEQEREIAKINAETQVQKTERDIERSTAEAALATKQTSLNRDVEIAQVEARRALESKDEELKRDVETKRAAAQMARLRAEDVVKATIARESKQQAADARAYEIEADAKANYEKAQKLADAAAYKTKVDTAAQIEADFNRITKATDAAAYKIKVDTEAQVLADYARTTKATDAAAYKTKLDSEAWAHAAAQTAEANLIKKVKEAEGIAAMANAYGKMAQAFGGPAGLLQYMMIEKGTYVELAKANATAVAGMQPKISVWNTGASGDGTGAGQSGIDTMRNVYQMLPPLMTTINEQTGITLPEWQFGRLSAGVNAIEASDAKVNGKM
jgi:flotillin